jgi:hypothetical protein
LCCSWLLLDIACCLLLLLGCSIAVNPAISICISCRCRCGLRLDTTSTPSRGSFCSHRAPRFLPLLQSRSCLLLLCCLVMAFASLLRQPAARFVCTGSFAATSVWAISSGWWRAICRDARRCAPTARSTSDRCCRCWCRFLSRLLHSCWATPRTASSVLPSTPRLLFPSAR